MQYLSRALVAAAALAACSAQAATTVDLGVAGQFSALTFGDFNGYSGDTGSLLAVGGNASFTNWTVNAYNLTGYNGYSFIVGGNLAANAGRINGNTAVVGTASLNGVNNTGPVSTGTSVLDFAALYGQLRNTSSATAAVAATGTVDYSGGSTFLTGTNSNVEVFSIDGSELSADHYLAALSGIKPNATVILNISGQNVNLGSFGIDLAEGPTQPNLLLNFYQATSLSFANLAVEGAVLAPDAVVTGTSGHIGGTFIARSFASTGSGNFEFHDINFNPVVIPSAVPEPETWAFLMAGTGCLTWSSRRRRKAR